MKSLTHKPTKAARIYWRKSTHLLSGFVDQAVVSLGSILYLIAAAQSLDQNEFGRFAIGISTVALLTSVTRALCGETILTQLKDSLPFSGQARSMLGVVVVIGLGCSIVLATASLPLPTYSGLLIGLALAIPGLLLQDSIRYLLIARRTPGSLLLNDSINVALAVLAILFVSAKTQQSSTALAAWGISAALVSVVTLALNRWWPTVKMGFDWLQSVWLYSSAYAVESITGAALGYTTILMIAVFASEAEVGAFRATVSVFGVTSVVTNFLRSSMLRELGRMGLDSLRKAMAIQGILAILMAVVVIGVGVILANIPPNVGTALFGQTWSSVDQLLPAGTMNRLAASLSVVPAVVLRVLNASWRVTSIRLGVGLVGLLFGPVGAILAGATGALYAETAVYALLAILLTTEIHRSYLTSALRGSEAETFCGRERQ